METLRGHEDEVLDICFNSTGIIWSKQIHKVLD